MNTYLYISFYTTSEAMATEKLAKELHLQGKLVPIPRYISAGCGIAFRTDLENRFLLQEALENKNIEYEDFHTVEAP